MKFSCIKPIKLFPLGEKKIWDKIHFIFLNSIFILRFNNQNCHKIDQKIHIKMFVFLKLHQTEILEKNFHNRKKLEG